MNLNAFQIRKLLMTLKTSSRMKAPRLGQRDYLIAVVIINAGARTSEVSDLKVADLSARALEIRTRGGRGGSPTAHRDSVELRPEVVSALRSWTKARKRCSPLFPSERRNPTTGSHQQMTARAVSRVIRTALDKAGLEGFSAEDLRRYFMRVEIETQLELGTVDLAFVAKRVRHSSPAQVAKLLAELCQTRVADHMKLRPPEL